MLAEKGYEDGDRTIVHSIHARATGWPARQLELSVSLDCGTTLSWHAIAHKTMMQKVGAWPSEESDRKGGHTKKCAKNACLKLQHKCVDVCKASMQGEHGGAVGGGHADACTSMRQLKKAIEKGSCIAFVSSAMDGCSST